MTLRPKGSADCGRKASPPHPLDTGRLTEGDPCETLAETCDADAKTQAKREPKTYHVTKMIYQTYQESMRILGCVADEF